MVRNLSEVYEYRNKLFRYDYNNCLVLLVFKADTDMYQDNIEWQEKYHKNLWDIDADGYVLSEAAGLHKENWDNKDARDEYLFEWCMELDEEAEYLVEDFLRYG